MGYQPATELRRWIINLLRADATLSDPTTGLLYSRTARINASDVRVYSAGVQLPEGSAIREALPRILVATLQHPGVYEQADALDAPCSVITHVLGSKEDEQLVEDVDVRVATLLLSTPVSDVRIIAAGLVADGTRSTERLAVLDGAWEIVSRYRSPNVGVLT